MRINCWIYGFLSMLIVPIDSTSKNTTKNTEIYSNCTGSLILEANYQPVRRNTSKIRKCCPSGQYYDKLNGTEKYVCVPDKLKFSAQIINAVFYQNCIEDSEKEIKLEYEYGNNCGTSSNRTATISSPNNELKHSFLYSNSTHSDEILYVLQNGSLLSIEKNFHRYDIFNDYCLDMNRTDNTVTAIVCASEFIKPITKAESFFYLTCLLVSVPCLLITAFFYLWIEDLRDLHGKSLACHSLCLATAFIFLIVIQIQKQITLTISYIIQYFILACFIWLMVMCADICIQVWFCLPRNTVLSHERKKLFFLIYFIASFGLPMVPVVMAYSQQILGVPLGYIKCIRFGITSSEDLYFLPPIGIILILCFFLLIASYYGFYKKNPSKNIALSCKGKINCVQYQDLKQAAKSTAFLYIIMSICTIFEIISFFCNSHDRLQIVDILIALQGVVIIIIFVCLKRPMNIIKRWWVEKGSLDLNIIEMEMLNNTNSKQ